MPAEFLHENTRNWLQRLEDAINALTGVSGALTLTETSTPTTVANKISVYGKDVAGITELFAKDSAGNEVQLTSNGQPVGAATVSNALTLPEQGSNPSTTANTVKLFSKDVSGISEMFIKDSAGNVIQVTSGGALVAASSFPSGLSVVQQSSAPSAATNTIKVYARQAAGRTELFALDASGQEIQITSNGVVAGTAGLGSILTLPEQVANPSAVTNTLKLFAKDVNGYTELFALNDHGQAVQLTSAGSPVGGSGGGGGGGSAVALSQNYTMTTSLADTGLTLALASGKTYVIHADLLVTHSGSSSTTGYSLAYSGTASAFEQSARIASAATTSTSRANTTLSTSMTDNAARSAGGPFPAEIRGTITTSSPGNLTVRVTSSAGTTNLNAGSSLWLQEATQVAASGGGGGGGGDGGSPSGMLIGANTWFLAQNYSELFGDDANYTGDFPMVSGINWATAYGAGTNGIAATNIWRPEWLALLAPYSYLRFMDWGQTNNSAVVNWSQRRAVTASQYELYSAPDSLPGGAGGGMSYEWQIDLCNRANKDMWVCIPHQASNDFVTQLATLIHSKLAANRKVHVEYSNETWNSTFGSEWMDPDTTPSKLTITGGGSGFTGGLSTAQFDWCIMQGSALGLPGSNVWYKGGSYSVYRSLQVFKIFQDVFGSSAMGTRVIRVVSGSGNMDVSIEYPLTNVYESATWNPNGQVIDLLCTAPYLFGSQDGADPNLTEMQDEIDADISTDSDGRVKQIKASATAHDIENWGTYEAGQQSSSTNTADQLAASTEIGDAYTYWLDALDTAGCYCFSQYTHCSQWTSGQAWGAINNTYRDIGTLGTWTDGTERAYKYEKLYDWWADNLE